MPNTITTKDGTQIYFKDWGAGQPVVLSDGWSLSAGAGEDQIHKDQTNADRLAFLES